MESTVVEQQVPNIKKQHSEVVKDEQAKEFFDDKEDSKAGENKSKAVNDPTKLKKQSSYTYWV